MSHIRVAAECQVFTSITFRAEIQVTLECSSDFHTEWLINVCSHPRITASAPPANPLLSPPLIHWKWKIQQHNSLGIFTCHVNILLDKQTSLLSYPKVCLSASYHLSSFWFLSTCSWFVPPLCWIILKEPKKAKPTRVTDEETCWHRMAMLVCLPVGWPTNLEQTEISQQLLIGSPWNVVQTFMLPGWWIVTIP